MLYLLQVMKQYPGLVQIPSFANLRRQLRAYSFRSWENMDDSEAVFSHPKFVKGQPELLEGCVTIRRRGKCTRPLKHARDKKRVELEVEDAKKCLFTDAGTPVANSDRTFLETPSSDKGNVQKLGQNNGVPQGSVVSPCSEPVQRCSSTSPPIPMFDAFNYKWGMFYPSEGEGLARVETSNGIPGVYIPQCGQVQLPSPSICSPRMPITPYSFMHPFFAPSSHTPGDAVTCSSSSSEIGSTCTIDLPVYFNEDLRQVEHYEQSTCSDTSYMGYLSESPSSVDSVASCRYSGYDFYTL